MKWIEEKMKLLGVSTNPSYKILGYLDYLAMVSVHVPKHGLLDVITQILALHYYHFMSLSFIDSLFSRLNLWV